MRIMYIMLNSSGVTRVGRMSAFASSEIPMKADAGPTTVAVAAAAAAILIVSLAGCASVPEGPGVLVLPGPGKTFDQFRLDDIDCRQFAGGQLGGSSANENA